MSQNKILNSKFLIQNSCPSLAPYLHRNLIGISSEPHWNLIGTSLEPIIGFLKFMYACVNFCILM